MLMLVSNIRQRMSLLHVARFSSSVRVPRLSLNVPQPQLFNKNKPISFRPVEKYFSDLPKLEDTKNQKESDLRCVFEFLKTNEYCLSKHEDDGMNAQLFHNVLDSLQLKLETNPELTLKQLFTRIKELNLHQERSTTSSSSSHQVVKYDTPKTLTELNVLTNLTRETKQKTNLNSSIFTNLDNLIQSLNSSLTPEDDDVIERKQDDVQFDSEKLSSEKGELSDMIRDNDIEHQIEVNNVEKEMNQINQIDEFKIDEFHKLELDATLVQSQYETALYNLKDTIQKMEQMKPKLESSIRLEQQQGNEIAKALYPLISSHANSEEYTMERARFLALRNSSNMEAPHDWYPAARLFRRKIIYHGGPTNSGKTYHALQALRAADSDKGGGVFCGPLRLLALEVFEELNSEGVYCSLMTGQERKEVLFANVLSCTIEMVNVNKVYDIAVIDEIQLIGDTHRGFAWTRAFLGLQAHEIHVCGSLEAEQLIRRLCKDTGDDFELRTYERMSPLKLLDEPLEDYENIQPGDCVVAFSRADIFRIREAIERLTPHKCCVIFGQLPPETRSKQAHLFNDVDSGYDVLVASDAVGMGLNLNIRRIVFHTTQKGGNGFKKAKLEASMMKQIAGRAGRRSSQYKDQGSATCLKQEDMSWMHKGINAPVKQVEKAGIFPTVEHLTSFCDLLEQLNLVKSDKSVKSNESIEGARIRISEVLDEFMAASRLPESGDYFISSHQEVALLSNKLYPVIGQLPLEHAFPFCQAPINTNNLLILQFLKKFAESWAVSSPTGLNVRLPNLAPRDVLQLSDLCTRHNIIDLYLWLSNRYPYNFVEKDVALKHKDIAINHIQNGLKHLYLDLDDIKRMSQDNYKQVKRVPAVIPVKTRQINDSEYGSRRVLPQIGSFKNLNNSSSSSQPKRKGNPTSKHIANSPSTPERAQSEQKLKSRDKRPGIGTSVRSRASAI